jgi:tRNA threonylcarbamoyladenosine modification (KEOPS) complex  Pcc1 subunit
MKTILTFFSILLINLSNAQSASDRITQALQMEQQVKEIQAQVQNIQKQAIAKKIEANKEKDITKKETLKKEAATLELEIKTKRNEAAILQKNAIAIRKEVNKLTPSKKINNDVINNINSTNNGVNDLLFATNNGIEIFELPNFQGRSKRFISKNEIINLDLPFNSENISIKFNNEEKIILYLVEGNDMSNAKAFINSQPSLATSAKNIYSIYIGKKVKLEVDFNGILTHIHNNDCKKLYGNISYYLKEYTNNGRLVKYGPYNIDGNIQEERRYEVFQQEKGTDYICPFVYNYLDISPRDFQTGYPLVSQDRRRFQNNRNGEAYLQTIAETNNNKQFFYVDSNALYNYRGSKSLSFHLVVKLGSAHKSCDLCTDFTWDAAMAETVDIDDNTGSYILINNKAISVLQFGEFRKLIYRPVGSRGSLNITNRFTGPEHPTYVQFSLKVVK